MSKLVFWLFFVPLMSLFSSQSETLLFYYCWLNLIQSIWKISNTIIHRSSKTSSNLFWNRYNWNNSVERKKKGQKEKLEQISQSQFFSPNLHPLAMVLFSNTTYSETSFSDSTLVASATNFCFDWNKIVTWKKVTSVCWICLLATILVDKSWTVQIPEIFLLTHGCCFNVCRIVGETDFSIFDKLMLA